MQNELIRPLAGMADRLRDALNGNPPEIWLYGSAASDDFRFGWSDLDLLCLTDAPLSDAEAERLLCLRQTYRQEEPDNPYCLLFEGAILSAEEYRSGSVRRAVYWGTTGQRITDRITTDVFARAQLAQNGIRLSGSGSRTLFPPPAREELIRGVRQHLLTIRRFARVTDERLYSCGWMLDIARGLYTVRNGTVVSKTEAGEWAAAESLCPDPRDLERTLLVRRDPLEYRDRDEIRQWLASLGPSVQRFADVLEQRLASE